MKKCIIYHTGVNSHNDGIIKDNKVYIQGDDKELYYPQEMFMAREECEGGLIQFEIDGKWCIANIYTGEIVIEPMKWEKVETSYENDLILCARKKACEPFVGSEDGLFAAIYNLGPKPTCDYFYKWGVYDKYFNMIIEPELDKEPYYPKIKKSKRSKYFDYCEKYYVLKKMKL